MSRVVLAAAVALLAGMAAGFGIAQSQRPGQDPAPVSAGADDRLRVLEAENKRLEDRAAALERERTELASKIDAQSKRPAETVPEQGVAAAPSEEFPEKPADGTIRNRQLHERGPAGPDDWPSSPEWQERRREMMTRFQERITERLAQQYDQAPDIGTQQRISDLGVLNNELFDLMTQLRAAETDEERDAIREQMRETFGQTQAIVQEQQRVILDEAAQSLGLTTQAEKDAYAASVRETMENPFFEPMMGAGGGFGRRGGGPGRWDGAPPPPE